MGYRGRGSPPAHHLGQLGDVDRLGEVKVEAGLQRLLPRLGAPVTGEGDQKIFFTSRLCPDATGELEAVDAWQPHVHQRISARRFERVSTRKKIATINALAASPQMLNW